VRLQLAVGVARGVGVATGTGRVPLPYADAVSADPSEAEVVQFETNAARQMAEVAARVKSGRAR